MFFLFFALMFALRLLAVDCVRIVENRGLFYVVSNGSGRLVPDLETLNVLRAYKAVTNMTDQEFGLLKMKSPTMSLKPRPYSLDEVMRVAVGVSEVLNPLDFNLGEPAYPFLWAAFLAIKDRVLVCYGDHLHENLHFRWIERGSHSLNKINMSETYLGIGPSTLITPQESFAANSDFVTIENPRLLLLSNGTIIMTYEALTRNIGHFQNMVAFSLDSTRLEYTFTNSSILGRGGPDSPEKNWIPFEHVDDQGFSNVFYVQSINPLHIVSCSGQPGTRLTIHTVSALPRIELPWPPYFGGRIRGGTTALLVNGLYLSFFHTRSDLHNPMISSYFGAFTFCPQHPFNIHSISPFPIVRQRLYDGQWMNKRYSYMIYPFGLIYDAMLQRIYVSLTKNEEEFNVLNVTVVDLFASLDFVSKCS
jgi:hypothetical protein